jgi:hypothetical protein
LHKGYLTYIEKEGRKRRKEGGREERRERKREGGKLVMKCEFIYIKCFKDLQNQSYLVTYSIHFILKLISFHYDTSKS